MQPSATSFLEKETSPTTTAAMVAEIRAEADAPPSPTAAAAGATLLVEAHPIFPSSSPPSSFTAFLAQVVPPGGIRSSIFNLAGASIGAGILGLPAASNDAGMLLSFILLLVITIFSVYSMYLLAVAAENTHIHSFEQMGKIVPILDVFRRRKRADLSKTNHSGEEEKEKGASGFDFSHVVAGIRFFHSYAGCVAYVISVNDCLSAILRPSDHASSSSTSHYKVYAVCGTILIWLVCMLPLMLPKHIDSLRYASTVAVCFMVYFVLVVVIHSCAHGLKENIHHVKWVGAHTRDTDTTTTTNSNNNNNGGASSAVNWVYLFRSGNPVIQSVGVFTFAYCCQINAFEVFWDLDHKIKKKRNHRNYTWAAFYAMLLCFTLYCGVIFFCYLDFGSLALENASILLLYAPMQEGRYYYILIAYVGVLVKLCVAYALLTSAARNSLYYLLGYQTKYHPTAATATGAEGEGGEEDLQGSFGDSKLEANANTHPASQHHGHGGKEVTYIDHIPTDKHRKVVLLLSVCTLISGLCIPHINVVFGFAGSLSGSCIAFVFPALFYYYSFDYYNHYKPSRAHKQLLREKRREEEEAREGVRKLVYNGSIEDIQMQIEHDKKERQRQRLKRQEDEVDVESGAHGSRREEEEVEVEVEVERGGEYGVHKRQTNNPSTSSSSSSSCDTTEDEDDEETILSGPPPLSGSFLKDDLIHNIDNNNNNNNIQIVTDTTTTTTAAAVRYGSAIKRKIPFRHVVGFLLLLVSGWVAMVWGTAGTIYNTVLGI